MKSIAVLAVCLGLFSESPVSALSSSSPPDLFAFPKLQVQFTRDGVTNESAVALLHNEAESGYELLRARSGRAFLCKLPDAPQDDPNAAPVSQDKGSIEAERESRAMTAQEQRQQKQVERQAGLERGLALLEAMRGFCIYQRLDWFTYGFCYGNSIRQFHEIRTQSGPKEDPNTDAYVLGKFPGANAASTPRRSASSDQPLKLLPGAAELVQSNAIGFAGNGLAELLSAEHEPDIHEDEDEIGKRYLVQHWTGGTTCDMTGLERRTEVQFHCNTQSNDRIALVRETAICQYVIVIHTPRLCGEPLFLASASSGNRPVQTIDCAPILSEKPDAAHQVEGRAAASSEDAQSDLPETQPSEFAEGTGPAADTLSQSQGEAQSQEADGEVKDEEPFLLVIDTETGEVLTVDIASPDDIEEEGYDASHPPEGREGFTADGSGEHEDHEDWEEEQEDPFDSELKMRVEHALKALEEKSNPSSDDAVQIRRLRSILTSMPWPEQLETPLDPKMTKQPQGRVTLGSHEHKTMRSIYDGQSSQDDEAGEEESSSVHDEL